MRQVDGRVKTTLEKELVSVPVVRDTPFKKEKRKLALGNEINGSAGRREERLVMREIFD